MLAIATFDVIAIEPKEAPPAAIEFAARLCICMRDCAALARSATAARGADARCVCNPYSSCEVPATGGALILGDIALDSLASKAGGAAGARSARSSFCDTAGDASAIIFGLG